MQTADELLEGEVLGVPAGPTPVKSVGEILREQHEAAQRRKTVGLKIPGYDSLYGVFRAVGDFNEIYAATSEERNRSRDEAGMTLGFAVDFLALASVETYALIDGQKTALPPLGVGLYDQLFPPKPDVPAARPGNDKEAVILLFPLGTYSIVEAATRLDAWQKGQAFQSDEEILGNS